MQLTTKETVALKAAFDSAAGNGHDFGLIEEIVDALRPMSAQAIGGLVSSLVKKKIIHVHGVVVTNQGTAEADEWTQFTWLITTSEVQALIDKGI